MIFSKKSGRAFSIIDFENEKELQEAIEKMPSLLSAISQLNRQDYPLLILKREFLVSSGPIDFLAIDMQGSLYLIETKLANNPEIRRTIIGQVVEYASNLSDKTYEAISIECAKYLGKQATLEHIIHNFYSAQINNAEPLLTADEFKKVITENLSNRRFNIVIIANKVSLEIQKLFHFIDQETKDNLNFIVLEVNKYQLDSEEVLHANIVWAAKYIKNLFSRSLINEKDFLTTKSSHVQNLIRQIDSICQSRGLEKTVNSTGLSWKNPKGGSVFISKNTLFTNWSTIRNKLTRFNTFKNGVIKEATEAGFQGRSNGISLELNDRVSLQQVEQFIELACSVIQKGTEMHKGAF